ncbi:MAG: hypothetical protein KAJ12_08735 [Bacteroidetes bacterium]|nr:hypothetical protein [Bacteroidota bacterium]
MIHYYEWRAAGALVRSLVETGSAAHRTGAGARRGTDGIPDERVNGETQMFQVAVAGLARPPLNPLEV